MYCAVQIIIVLIGISILKSSLVLNDGCDGYFYDGVCCKVARMVLHFHLYLISNGRVIIVTEDLP